MCWNPKILHEIICTCLVLKNMKIQKQPFVDVLQNRCSWKLGKIRGEASVLESLFKINLVCNFIKNQTLIQVFFCGFCRIFESTCFTEYIRTTVSGNYFEVSQKFVDIRIFQTKSRKMRKFIVTVSNHCLEFL